MPQEVFSICFMCTVRCPIRVEVENDEVKWIEGNPHVPGMEGSWSRPSMRAPSPPRSCPEPYQRRRESYQQTGKALCIQRRRPVSLI